MIRQVEPPSERCARRAQLSNITGGVLNITFEGQWAPIPHHQCGLRSVDDPDHSERRFWSSAFPGDGGVGVVTGIYVAYGSQF